MNRWFARFADREGITDGELKEAAARLEAGQPDADLGGGVYKARLARPGEGKAGGYRAIVFYKNEEWMFFVYGFAKAKRRNIDKGELRNFKKDAKDYLSLTGEQIEYRKRILIEVL